VGKNVGENVAVGEKVAVGAKVCLFLLDFLSIFIFEPKSKAGGIFGTPWSDLSFDMPMPPFFDWKTGSEVDVGRVVEVGRKVADGLKVAVGMGVPLLFIDLPFIDMPFIDFSTLASFDVTRWAAQHSKSIRIKLISLMMAVSCCLLLYDGNAMQCNAMYWQM
jgi:hypothetical protein